MSRKKLSKNLVLDYHAFLAKRYDVKWSTDKKARLEVSKALSAMGCDLSAGIPKRVSITLWGTSYLAYTPGVGSQSRQLRLPPHECTHAVQQEHYPPAEYAWRYVFDVTFRARMEMEALQTDLDLHYWRTGRLRSVNMMIGYMKFYQLPREDLNTIRTHLIECNKIIDRTKKPISPVGKVAVNWLNRHV